MTMHQGQQLSTCSVCLQQIQSMQMSTPQLFAGKCLHIFCQECIIKHAKNCLQNFKPITCLQQHCSSRINSENSWIFSKLSLSEQHTFKKLNILSMLLSGPTLKMCVDEDCQGIVNVQQQPIACDTCLMKYCVECLQKQHKGVECDEEVALFLERSNKFKVCSNCKRVIEKGQGCNHIKCLCGNNFCYVCGQPNHSGECMIPERIKFECFSQQMLYSICHCKYWYESYPITFDNMLDTFINGFPFQRKLKRRLILPIYMLFLWIPLIVLAILCSLVVIVIQICYGIVFLLFQFIQIIITNPSKQLRFILQYGVQANIISKITFKIFQIGYLLYKCFITNIYKTVIHPFYEMLKGIGIFIVMPILLHTKLNKKYSYLLKKIKNQDQQKEETQGFEKKFKQKMKENMIID